MSWFYWFQFSKKNPMYFFQTASENEQPLGKKVSGVDNRKALVLYDPRKKLILYTF